MTITLYLMNEEVNKVRKTPIQIATLTGYFRNGSSITKPIFDIESDMLLPYDFDIQYDNNDIQILDGGELYDISVSDGSFNIFDVNYIYCEELHRYYFVNDIILLNNRLYQFQCSVDVLMSYKNEFLPLSALVERNENLNNIDIEDNMMSYKYKLNVDEYNLGGGRFTFNPAVEGDEPRFTFNYVITYSDEHAIHEETIVSSQNNLLPAVGSIACGKNLFSKTRVMRLLDVNLMAKEVVQHENYASFIISLIAYPFEVPHQGDDTAEVIILGNNTMSDSYGWKLETSQMSEYYIVADDYIGSYGGYMDCEPYTKYEIFLPYYGYYELKSSDILNCRIQVLYSFDFTTGSCKINIFNYTKNYVIASVNGNCGVKIAVNRSNNQQLSDEKTSLAIKSAISTISSLASIGVGAYTGNPYLVAGGVTGISSTAVDIGEKLALMHQSGNVSINSGVDGLYSVNKVRLKKTTYEKYNITDFKKYYGYPVNQTYQLSGLSGFTTIKEIHLEQLDCTKIEQENIELLLKNGVIL